MDDRASKLKGLMWLAVACLIGAGIAVGLSPLAHAIPWAWERKIAYATELDAGEQACRSPQAQGLLQRIVNRLYPVQPDDGDFSVEVQVARNVQVNAYAMLGGRIFINTGLIKQAESPEEVAGVLAHEIGHVHHRHIMEGMLRNFFTSQSISIIFGSTSAGEIVNYFTTMDFTRTQEAQADEDGLARLQKAHIDNQGFRHFFERMGKSSMAEAFLSDHPSGEDRIAMVAKFPNQGVKPIMTAEEWAAMKSGCSSVNP